MSTDLPAGSFLFGAHTEADSRMENIRIQAHAHTLMSNPSTGINVASAEMKQPFSVQPLTIHSTMPSKLLCDQHVKNAVTKIKAQTSEF